MWKTSVTTTQPGEVHLHSEALHCQVDCGCTHCVPLEQAIGLHVAQERGKRVAHAEEWSDRESLAFCHTGVLLSDIYMWESEGGSQG